MSKYFRLPALERQHDDLKLMKRTKQICLDFKYFPINFSLRHGRVKPLTWQRILKYSDSHAQRCAPYSNLKSKQVSSTEERDFITILTCDPDSSRHDNDADHKSVKAVTRTQILNIVFIVTIRCVYLQLISKIHLPYLRAKY